MQMANVKGFTLIEMILVAAILGIFAAGILAFTNPHEQILKANDARRKSDLAQIQKALESYYQDNGRYPGTSANKIYTSTLVNWGAPWQPYMNIVPQDPAKNHTYVYYSSANGQSYVLYANVERGGKDPQSCNSGNPCSSLATYGISSTACGATCNYAVASSDIVP
jgi:type II secretion system protein G